MYLRNVTVCLAPLTPTPGVFRHMLHLLRQQSRQLHQSQGPCCCPRWAAIGSSDQRCPTPDRCRWRGRSRMTGQGSWVGQTGCRLPLWAGGGCWWWSPRCSPEGCWPDRGHGCGPMPWGSYRSRLLSGWLPSTPVPAPAERSSIDNMREPSSLLIRWEKKRLVSYLFVRGQLLLQLLCLLLDGTQIVLYGLARMHPSVKAVVQPPPKPLRCKTLTTLRCRHLLLLLPFGFNAKPGRFSNTDFTIHTIT